MIKINKIKEPSFFKSSKAKKIKNILSIHFNKSESDFQQSKFPVKNLGAEFKLYLPKLIVSIANRYATGTELSHKDFSRGIGTQAFKVL